MIRFRTLLRGLVVAVVGGLGGCAVYPAPPPAYAYSYPAYGYPSYPTYPDYYYPPVTIGLGFGYGGCWHCGSWHGGWGGWGRWH